ncbi:MAG: DUF3604 domain-containing protein [Polyangiaceae bacterium]
MRTSRLFTWMALVASSSLVGACVASPTEPDDAEEEGPGEAQEAVTNCPDRNPYGNLYWGELHQHTMYSLDAYSFGNRSDPGAAYAFAKGDRLNPPKEITLAEGSADVPVGGYKKVTQRRNLDFAAVTDHSEWLSSMETCVLDTSPGNTNYGSDYCVTVRSSAVADENKVFASMVVAKNYPCNGAASCPQEQSAWAREVAFADAANDACNFTALPAYEWTDMKNVNGTNATDHRNVIFSTSAVPSQPLDSAHYTDPPALWSGLSSQCVPPACDAVTIPHNSNMSAGVSLQIWDPSTNGVALQRRYQVSAEIFQHKGNSECYIDPTTGATKDDKCAFEQTGADPVIPADFVRNALMTGVQYAADHTLQGNPLQLGVVGATDNHNSTPGYVYEDSWKGHVGRNDDTPLERLRDTPKFNPGGVTGAWAPQNTRADIFSAIQNRQTYATSGPRIRLRVFQTSNLGACQDAQFPKQIVDASQAVPMGGTFRQSQLTSSGGVALAIWAFPDTFAQGLADGTFGQANIERVQIIKAYIDGATGQIVESADCSSDPNNCKAAVVANFPATGGCVVWQDPSFDKTHRAVYYVRVLQVPTWRWSHWDCQSPGMQSLHPTECAPSGAWNTTVQERAWTSPLWYVPGG